ncbi:MAG: choice-of-anchor tandem repeat NxxGxxAF-containing protein [Cyanobacteria bacterium J06639_14]
MAILKNIPLVTAIAASFTLLTSASAEAFTFVEIANTNAPEFTDIDTSAYAINDLGEVAFVGDTMGQSGIFVGDGGAISTVVDPAEGFDNIAFVDINSAGTTVFHDINTTAIYTVNGGVITPILNEGSSLGQIGFTIGGFVPLDSPVINEAGVVAFKAANSDIDREGVYVIEGGVVTTIVDDPNIDIFRFALNNNGEVAFSGLESVTNLTTDGLGAFFSDGMGPLIAFPDPLEFGTDFATVEGPTLNDDGTVAFDRLFIDEMGNPRQGIFTQNSEGAVLIVDDSGEFSNSFQRPAINNQGNIVFAAGLDVGSPGIYTGPDPVADRLIGIGDMLFGATITGLSFTQQTGLNNQGQIAFTASFDDGSVGIFRADPEDSDMPSVPEPMSVLGLLAVGAAGVVAQRHTSSKA